MPIRQPADVPASEITPEAVWQSRRRWLKQAVWSGAALSLGAAASNAQTVANSQAIANSQTAANPQPITDTDDAAPLPGAPNPQYTVMDKPTSYKDITSYNNFYEFGLDKSDPAEYAGKLVTRPWTVSIEGEVAQARTFGIDDLLKLAPMEDRVYRLRCVEGWSMVIPWLGYSLSALLKQVAPTGNAKYVEFVSAVQKETMPGIKSNVLDWPYVEGLRLDEAMNPLTMLVFGLYGKVLPRQDGAPLRLAVPWKYGFKSAKSLVTIRLVEHQPRTSWMKAASNEYGFYANVNPDVPHPRWSQAAERRIGDAGGPFAPKRKTLMFNGYGEQVAAMYAGMDLKANF